MRVGLFLPSLAAGGAERITLTLAEGLSRRGYQVDLVLARADGPLLAQIPSPLRLVDFKSGRVAQSLLPLVRYLKRERPVVLLSSLNHANVVAIWARRMARVPTRLVVAEHIGVLPSAAWSQTLRGKLMPFWIRNTYPWADAVVAVSRGVAEELVRDLGVPREKVRTIYNPVVTEELYQKAEEPLEHPWFRPGEEPVVLGVGRLVPQKDFSLLIRAFAKVRQRVPSRLLILGEGPERPALEALVRGLGLEAYVEMPGFMANPYPYMRRASVLALSSASEALPTVLIEALALGTKVVATDCPYGPAEVLEGGRWGRLVPVGDEEALAKALMEALLQPDSETEKQARARRARERFGLEEALRAYEEVLGLRDNRAR
ncbi:glycosyltransferase [Thermus thermamylovorans]|uniref:Glycosyltransferase n=1 Tax=Thermus thermamylovorans TaxID=2509362 RepID=A0A4Q9B7V5_9DEIN|nr:glycosyltransferase [Thermus thermamylovorans]TBH21911.1 glycosyltransferase [Thermus thermamylovorans]